MNVELKPELERFLDEQVKAGRFSSASAAVEAGIARLMLDPEPDAFDEQDLTEIRQSLDEMRRGDVLDGEKLHRELRSRYLGE